MVLHAENDAGNPENSITLKARDESRYYEQQIWWIERCPECDNFDTDPIYQITNTASNRCLSMDRGYPLLSQTFGEKQEQWSLQVEGKEKYRDTGSVNILLQIYSFLYLLRP